MRVAFAVSISIALLVGPRGALGQMPAAQQPSAASEISASGTADIRLAPDRAGIYVTVETRNKTATAAMAANTASVSAVVNALHRAGVPENQLTTSDRSVDQDYSLRDDRRGPPVPDGFVVRTSLSIETQDVNGISKLVDAALEGGATRIGVRYWSSKMADARRSALGAAFTAAQADGSALAQAAGGRLGRLLSAVPNGASPVFMRGSTMFNEVVTGVAGGSAAFSLPPASVASTVTVVARWEFFPGATAVPQANSR